MPKKGYWIARVDVHDEAGFAAYTAANPAVLAKFGGRYILRGGRSEVQEGPWRAFNVVVEFPDYETALACYRSPEYLENVRMREPFSTVDLVVVEGLEA